MGKHDWGPWNSAVRTLITNANLLGHIADDPLSGMIFDPGLWPTLSGRLWADSIRLTGDPKLMTLHIRHNVTYLAGDPKRK